MAVVDPEPPAPDDAVDPPDYQAMYAALRKNADKAVALLTKEDNE